MRRCNRVGGLGVRGSGVVRCVKGLGNNSLSNWAKESAFLPGRLKCRMSRHVTLLGSEGKGAEIKH